MKKLPDAEKRNEMAGKLLDVRDSDECCKCKVIKGVFAGPPSISACGHLFCEVCAKFDRHVEEEDSRTCPFQGCKKKLSPGKMYTQAELIGENNSGFDEADIGYMGFDSNGPFSKFLAVEHYLRDRMPAGDKAIVFSQWTSSLDLLQVHLRKCGFKTRRVDGTMPIQKRDKNLHEFLTTPEVRVILLSLMAANTGLNITAANHVLYLDIWWNPNSHEQGTDRTHRLGQTKPVKVVQIIMRDSIEERIWAAQDRKRGMIGKIMNGEGHQVKETFIEELFNVKNQNGANERGKKRR